MLDLHLWKLTEKKQLVNKALGHAWKYAHVHWNIEGGSKIVDIVDETSGNLLVPNKGKPLNRNTVDLEIRNKFQNQKWQFVKSSDIGDTNSGWRKVKHNTSGYFLEVSDSGDHISIQVLCNLQKK